VEECYPFVWLVVTNLEEEKKMLGNLFGQAICHVMS